MPLEKQNKNYTAQSRPLIIEYINTRLKSLNWNIKELAKRSNISQGEISKILNNTRKGLKARTFYNLYCAFGDSCCIATQFVFPSLDLSLNKYSPKKRNEFGKLMQTFEISVNSIEEISTKTGIIENRLKDLYFRKGSIEANELILIERAVGMKIGELFDILFKNSK